MNDKGRTLLKRIQDLERRRVRVTPSGGAVGGGVGTGSGGGAALSNNTPAALGTAAAGSGTAASRDDHVHTLPKLDDAAAADDNTDLNASTTKHGLQAKGTGSTTTFYRSDNTQAAIQSSSTTVAGIVELATDGESSSSVVVAGNDSRVPGVFLKRHIFNITASGTVFTVGTSAGCTNTAWTSNMHYDTASHKFFMDFLTGGTTNSQAGYAQTSNNLFFEPFDSAYFQMKTAASIAAMRIWCAVYDDGGGELVAGDTGGSSILYGFRYSTSAGDANWQGCTNNATGALTAVDTGVAVATDTVYEMVVKQSTYGTYTFSVNGSSPVSISSNVPVNNYGRQYMKIRTLEAVAKTVYLGNCEIRLK